MRKRVGDRLFAGITILVTTVSTIGITEISLRIFDYPNLPISGWRHATGINDINQLGYRGRTIDYSNDDFVVLLVGDSQVECVTCAPTEIPEIVLERELVVSLPNVRVFSLGARGYGQDQELLAMQEYFKKFRANLVLVWQTLGNDIWNNTFPTHGTDKFDGTPKPTFRLKRNMLIEPNQTIGDPVYRSRIEALMVMRLWGGLDSFWEIYLPEPYKPRKIPTSHTPGADMLSTSENLKAEKSHWSIWLIPTSGRTQYGMDLTKKLLQQMKDLARSNDAAFIIFQEDRNTPVARKACEKFPFYREGHSFIEFQGQFYEANSEQYYVTRDYVNAGFPFFSIPITEPNHIVNPDDCHLNLSGNLQVLGDLSRTIINSRYLADQRKSKISPP